MPVVPPESRRATLNVNTVFGGQAGEAVQTPCVADRCTAIFDRRFLPEEGLAGARRELLDLVARVQEKLPELRFEIEDRMVVHPVETPADSPLVAALARAIREVCGREAALVASPGSYDHKHVARIAGVEQCVAYGPGRLELAHQPDEYCEVADLAASIQVLALAIVELVGVAGG
jgi:succinyl-diaminopimelate desuccinylase